MPNHRVRKRVGILSLSSVLALSCNTPTSNLDMQRAWTQPMGGLQAAAPTVEAPSPVILPKTYFSAARLFESRGQFRKALTQYRKAVAVDHEYVDAFHRLGLVYSVLGDRAAAVEALSQAVSFAPKDAILRNNLGFELLLSERWAEASRELQYATSLEPDFARAQVNLGIAQSRLGDFDEALTSFRAVLPEADAYFNLGLMLRGQKRYDEAAEAFERVISINPTFTVARQQLDQIAPKLTLKPEPDPAPEALMLPAASPTVRVVENERAVRTETSDATETVGKSIAGSVLPDPTETVQETWEELFPWLDEGLSPVQTERIVEPKDTKGKGKARLTGHKEPSAPKSDETRAQSSAWNDSTLETIESVDEWNSFGADMPDYFSEDLAAEMSYSPADFFEDLPPSTDRVADFAYDPMPAPLAEAVASEADFVEDSYLLVNAEHEQNCDDHLLVDDLSAVARADLAALTSDVIGDSILETEALEEPFDNGPAVCGAEAEVILAVIQSYSPQWCVAPRRNAVRDMTEHRAIASVDAVATLKALELELALVRDEIHCLESLGEEQSEVSLASAHIDGFLGVEAPIPPESELLGPVSQSASSEMGPPLVAPLDSRLETGRWLLASARTPQPQDGQHSGTPEPIEFEIRVAPLYPFPMESGQRQTQSPTETASFSSNMADLDTLLAIVLNDLMCEDEAREERANRVRKLGHEPPVDATEFVPWPVFDIDDARSYPHGRTGSSVDLFEPVTPFRHLPAPPIPGWEIDARPRGTYGHHILPNQD